MRHFLHEGQILFTDCKKSKMATVLIEDDNRLKKRHKTTWQRGNDFVHFFSPCVEGQQNILVALQLIQSALVLVVGYK